MAGTKEELVIIYFVAGTKEELVINIKNFINKRDLNLHCW